MTSSASTHSLRFLDDVSQLSIESVWNEWLRWATQSDVPSCGLNGLVVTGCLDLYPELAALPGVPQDPTWHPEGDVWIHTLHVCDAAARIAEREQLDGHQRAILLFAALCHDLGKATTTEFKEGRWRAHGHCEAGVPLTRTFLTRIGCPESLIQTVEPLVAEHLVHVQHGLGPRTVRRLKERLKTATITQLVQLIEADLNGRPPLPGGLPASVRKLVELAENVQLEPPGPKPIVLGRHLIALGYQPGVEFSKHLKRCLEAQLNDEFATEADGVEFLRNVLQEG